MKDIFNRRLLITMGKGGVGRSLVSAALVQCALKRGKKVLCVQISSEDRLSSLLGCPKATSEVKEVLPGLFMVNIQAMDALKEYAVMQVRLEFIYRLVFENRAVKYFIRAVPALKDLVVLGKILFHEKETDASGKPLYDIIIVDAPPTGHGIFLLNIPSVMLSAVQSGPINREVRDMYKVLTDPTLTAVNFVSLPEEMPANETMELYKKLLEEYRLPPGLIFINAVFPTMFSAREEKIIDEFSEGRFRGDWRMRCLMRCAHMSVARRRLNEKYVELLETGLPLDSIKLPYVFSDEMDSSVTGMISETIDVELASSGRA